jgi:hypothetical protein
MHVISATQEEEIRGMGAPGQPKQRVLATPSQSITQAWRLMSVIPAIQEVTG